MKIEHGLTIVIKGAIYNTREDILGQIWQTDCCFRADERPNGTITGHHMHRALVGALIARVGVFDVHRAI